MQNTTRLALNAYIAAIATLNGVSDASQKFTATPSVQQTLESHIQQSSAFLKAINIVGVDDQSGEKIGLGISGPIAGTTDTTSTDRTPTDYSVLDNDGYICTQTNFDTALKYSKLDQWAKFPNFEILIRDAILKRQALDRIMIGWNGTSRAATSNKSTNPLLQDVNKGWIKKWIDGAPARVMTEVLAASNIVAVGSGVALANGYKNLDALVFDAIGNLIDPAYREDPELVVILGRGLLDDKYFPVINQANVPSEQLALDMVISQKRIGGLGAVAVPYFPANTMCITKLSNLSLYYQNGKRRRNIVDNSKRDQVENYESSNEAYVVEDYAAGCVIKNIVLS